jgi:hypothetical protein
MLRSAPHHLELARCAFTKSQPLDDHFILIEPAWLLGLYHRLGGRVRITLRPRLAGIRVSVISRALDFQAGEIGSLSLGAAAGSLGFVWRCYILA